MSTHSSVDAARARRLLYAGTLIAVVMLGAVAVVLRAGGSAGRGAANPAPRPVAALAPSASAISRLLGADEPRFWARGTSTFITQRNHGQRLSIGYSPEGVRVDSAHGSIGMRLTTIEQGAQLSSVAPIAPRSQANRVTFARPRGITEWYANGPLGLEQGLTLHSAPAAPGDGSLRLRYRLSGSLTPQLRGGILNFSATAGAAPLISYRGLSATDAKGRTLPAGLSLSGDVLTITVDGAGARYPITVDPTIQNANLTGSDSVAGDGFGFAVAQNASGSLVVVGAPYATVGANRTGAAYVFVKPANGWANATQTNKLTAPDGAGYDQFGRSVGVVGSTVVVGSPFHAVGGVSAAGAIYAYPAPVNPAGTPVELVSTPAAPNTDLGLQIAVAGPQLFAGGNKAVFEFTRPPNGWTATTAQSAILTPSDSIAPFGSSLAAGGTTVVVGAPFSTQGANSAQGSVYVFTEPATGWRNENETAKLTASNGAAYDQLGTSVAFNADTGTIAVGAPGHGTGGAVYVFQEPTSGWQNTTETAVMTKAGAPTGTQIGHTVAITDPAGTGPPLPPGAKAADVSTPTITGWKIAVVGGSSNGTGLTVWNSTNGTWTSLAAGTPVSLPVYGTGASAYSVNLGPGLMAVGNNSGNGSIVLIPVPPTQCTTVGCCPPKAGDIAPIGVRPNLNNFNCDNRGAYYYAQTALNTVQQGVGALLVPVGAAITWVGWFGELPSAGASTIAVVGGPLVAGTGYNLYNSASNAQHDPPDPNFQTLLAVPRVRPLTLHAGRGLTARAAKALGRYATDLRNAGAVAGTLATTINRAGGAIAASDTTWEGRQIRYAIALTQRFKSAVDVAAKDAKSVIRAATGSPALNVRLSLAKLRAAQRRYANRPVPAGLARLAATYGVSASELQAGLKAKLPKHIPRTLLEFLTGKSTLASLQQAVKAYVGWTQVPQIVSESKLQ